MGRIPDDDIDGYSSFAASFDEASEPVISGEDNHSGSPSEDESSLSSGQEAIKTAEVDETDDWTLPASDSTEANTNDFSLSGTDHRGQSQTAPTAPPLPPPSGGGRLMHVLRPRGYWNQRIILVAIVIVAALVLLLVSGNSRDPFKAQGKGAPEGQAARDLFGLGTAEEVKPLRTSINSGGALMTPELGAPGQAVSFDQGNIKGTSGAPHVAPGVVGSVPPPVIPPVVSYASPVSSSSSSFPGAAPSAGAVRPQGSALDTSATVAGNSFAVRLRAGVRAEGSEAQREQPLAEDGRAGRLASPAQIGDARSPLPRGSRLQLVLLEPIRSGIAASITARVVADLSDSHGQRLVPAGSTTCIPFLPQEVNGRVVNDRAGEGFVMLPNGTQLALQGTVKGADGYAGLAGRVRKTGDRGTLRRIGRALARTGGGIINSQTGMSTSEVEDALSVRDEYTAPSERVVEIPAGTRFSFIIGL